MNYYISVFKKYAVFSGRARRAEYWYFVLFSVSIGFALTLIQTALVTATEINTLIGLTAIYRLAIFIPTLAVGVRRMHDINKSGWFLFIPIYNLIWLITDGTKGNNKYGSDPKEIKVM